MTVDEVRRAARCLELAFPFDRLGLKRAYRHAILKVHPDLQHSDTTAAAQEVNLAREMCLKWLEGDVTTETTDTSSRTPPEPTPPVWRERASRAPDPRTRDFRDRLGALWTGLHVDVGVALPPGWGRKGATGEVFTTLNGAPDALVAALLRSIPAEAFDWAPPFEDKRAKKGALWSGFQVGTDERLPDGWTRAGVGDHAGQAWFMGSGDAATLVDQLRRHIDAPQG